MLLKKLFRTLWQYKAQFISMVIMVALGVGVFLGSALAMAAVGASTGKGVLLLLCYSAGLAIPFAISAIAIDKVAGAFTFIKKNYKTINLVCGLLLVAMGVLMATGLMSTLLQLLS